jgi:hypothetical protein
VTSGNNQQNNTSNSGERNNAKTKTQHNDKINKATAATGFSTLSCRGNNNNKMQKQDFKNTEKTGKLAGSRWCLPCSVVASPCRVSTGTTTKERISFHPAIRKIH